MKKNTCFSPTSHADLVLKLLWAEINWGEMKSSTFNLWSKEARTWTQTEINGNSVESVVREDSSLQAKVSLEFVRLLLSRCSCSGCNCSRAHRHVMFDILIPAQVLCNREGLTHLYMHECFSRTIGPSVRQYYATTIPNGLLLAVMYVQGQRHETPTTDGVHGTMTAFITVRIHSDFPLNW